jgi:hypothetical protein
MEWAAQRRPFDHQRHATDTDGEWIGYPRNGPMSVDHQFDHVRRHFDPSDRRTFDTLTAPKPGKQPDRALVRVERVPSIASSKSLFEESTRLIGHPDERTRLAMALLDAPQSIEDRKNVV